MADSCCVFHSRVDSDQRILAAVYVGTLWFYFWQLGHRGVASRDQQTIGWFVVLGLRSIKHRVEYTGWPVFFVTTALVVDKRSPRQARDKDNPN